MNTALPSIIPDFGRFACILLAVLSAPVLAQEETDAPEAEQPEPAMASERPLISTGLSSEAVARNHPNSAVWLSAGGQGRVLALFQPEQESPARGALLVLADEGVSAASGLVDAIRQPLSKAGWAVMSLGLEAPALPLQHWLMRQANAEPGMGDPGQEASTEGKESSVMINVMDKDSPSDALAAYREQVLASITAAVDELEKREYDRIVLAGIGRAAGHVTRQARADGRASDLVWIAPQFYADESDGLAGLLGAAASPSVLELYSTFPGDDTLDRAVQERAAAMERAGISGYARQPVAMSRRPLGREAHKLSNRISAWLRSTVSKR